MTLRTALYSALESRREVTHPFRHWLLKGTLEDEVCATLVDLPFEAPSGPDNQGKRDTFNEERHFFSVANRARYPLVDEISKLLQDPETVRRLEHACDVSLDGAYLRVEFCVDRSGFWLAPHADIAVKRFTMQIFLSDDTDPTLGTDLYDRDFNWVCTVPAARGNGYIFIPAPDTIHGFRKRSIAGVRKSLIVNYVSDEWRAREELSFPDHAVAH